MFVLVATTVIVVLVVYVLSFLTQDILYLKRFLCVCVCACVCVCVPLLHLNHTRRHFHVSDFITQWGRVRECSA